MKLLKKSLSLLLVALMVLTLAVPAMAAEDEYVYVAFGDSIAAGYGLSDYELSTDNSDLSYVKQISGDATLYDLAGSGMNSAELLQLLSQPETLEALAGADLVTISIGGNDLILALIQAILPDMDIESLQLSQLAEADFDQIPELAEQLGLDDISTLMPALMGVIGQLGTISDGLRQNLSASLAAIKAAAPQATVVVQTIFNPYRGSELFGSFQSSLDAVFTTVNASIQAAAEANGALVADVFTAFVEYGQSVLSSADIFYDPHPNYNGHVIIAETIINTLTAANVALPGNIQPLANTIFPDVTAASPYLEAVKAVYDAGIMNGVDGGMFAPDEGLNRAMIVTILSRIDTEEGEYPSGGFTDVPAGAWYESAVNWASSKEIVTGYGNGLFGPLDNVTRQQLAVLLYRFFGSPAVTGTLEATDAAQAAAWATDALIWATEQGVLEADSTGALRPTEPATRGEAALAAAAGLTGATPEAPAAAPAEAPAEGEAPPETIPPTQGEAPPPAA